MDLRRLSAGEWIAGLAGLVLLASLFATWYEPQVSGWEAFRIADVVFAAAALLAVAGWVTGALDRTNPTAVSVLSLGLLVSLSGSVIALYRLIDPVGDGAVERAAGSWIGLIAVLVVTGGIVRAMRDEGAARRDPEREQRAAAAALEQAELLELPPQDRAPVAKR